MPSFGKTLIIILSYAPASGRPVLLSTEEHKLSNLLVSVLIAYDRGIISRPKNKYALRWPQCKSLVSETRRIQTKESRGTKILTVRLIVLSFMRGD